ncbi:hypothetical protein [Parasediminibacterium sp. JCM 36343]|uniref:hypothetical protein n=1 Tax=Parasediminibacterium sp. JCM 36343 TaxID=3374279 RepID=UPI00397B1A5F
MDDKLINLKVEEEIFLVEELENFFANESVIYYKKVCDEWETQKFDPMDYDRLLSGKILWEFNQLIYNKINNLNNQEATRFFALSLTQFITHSPANRIEAFAKKYHKAYWAPEIVEFQSNASELNNVKYIWSSYKRAFPYYKEATEKAFEDYKSTVLGLQIQNPKINDINTKQIQFEQFSELLITLNGYLTQPFSPLDFKSKLEISLEGARNEILNMLIALGKDDRKPYLNRLQHSLRHLERYSNREHENIDVILSYYNIDFEGMIPCLPVFDPGNKLYEILSTIPTQVDNKFTPDYDREWYNIQKTFYQYYFNTHFAAIHNFIQQQIEELNPTPIIPNAVDEKVLTPKLKTNLSVPQLALLFKMLNELKPNIFMVKTEAELHRFISTNFETKQSKEEGISTDKLRILFNQPDSKAAEFWAKHFYTLTAEIKKFK